MDHTCQLLNMRGWLICLFFALASFPADCSATTTLFQDDFSSGDAPLWQFENGWSVISDAGNSVLSGSTHSWATAGSLYWRNYTFKTKIKLADAGSAVHINYRSSGCNRYFVGFNSGGLYLSKTYPCSNSLDISTISELHDSNQWYTVEIVGNAGNIKVYVDGTLKINHTDNDPPPTGSIAFEVLFDTPVYFDDVLVTTDEPLSQTPWVSPVALSVDLAMMSEYTRLTRTSCMSPTTGQES